MSADELKAQGNAAFSAGKYEEAISLFTRAITADPSNHVLYSNRSACHASLSDYGTALKDAQKCIELKSDWPKGYSRLGAALVGLKDPQGACKAYRQGLALDPTSAQMQDALRDAETTLLSVLSAEERALFLSFRDPKLIPTLLQNPVTRDYLGQADFQAKLKDLTEDPSALQRHVSDPRILHVLETVMGVKVMSKEEAVREQAREEEAMRRRDELEEERRLRDDAARKQREEEEAAQKREAALTDEERAARKRHQEALEWKDKGNECYKQRQFDQAIEHYNRALSLYDADISFLTNRAAVHYESGNLEECLADCDAAVERGRELRADFKLIAKALARKGAALVKADRLEEALTVLQKSLTEHRHPDTLKKMHECERTIEERKKSAYINLDLCAEEREKGNVAFRESKFVESIAHYSEAIKRGPPEQYPECYKLYANRSASYLKLGAVQEALKDADKCIELHGTWGKGYLRRGNALFLMKEYEKALDSFQKGLDFDPENAELLDGVTRCMTSLQRFMSGQVSEEELALRREKAMADPNVQNILVDPVMRNVLRDLQENPRAAQQHLKDPSVAAKLSTLVRAGIVRMG